MSLLSGGGPLSSDQAAVATADGRLLAVPCADDVRIYSTATVDVVGVLRGHTQKVTAVCGDPKNPGQVYTSSLDGTVRLWRLHSAELQEVFQIGHPVVSLVVPADGCIFNVSVDWKGISGRVLYYNMEKQKLMQPTIRMHKARPLSVSPEGCTVATFDKHRVIAWSLKGHSKAPLCLKHTKPFTCVAVDASEEVVAAGDASGRILIWHGLREGVRRSAVGERVGELPCSTVHWHAHAVGALAFSPDSNYLLSGGQENVLVIWQLETGKRTYLPRLGGSITAIRSSPADAAKYTISQDDNTVRVINTASMAVETSVYGVRPPATSATRGSPRLCAPPTLDPSSGYLVLPTANSGLQFYDTVHDRHVALLQVSPRNSVSLTETQKQDWSSSSSAPSDPIVQHLAFSGTGNGMLTLDSRPDAGSDGGAEVALKFWDRATGAAGQSLGPRYVLNTQVDDPHRGTVTCVAHHPHNDVVVSTGSEGDFRVWARQAGPRRSRGDPAAASSRHWQCRSVASYRDEPLHTAAWSGDGSLLAVAAGDSPTLWEPATSALLAALAPPIAALGHALKHLCFVPGTPFLVGAYSGVPILAVWNILTSSLWWTLPVNVHSLSADPVSGTFAAVLPQPPSPGSPASQADAVVLFRPSSPRPVHTWACKQLLAGAMYAPPGTPLHSAAQRMAPQGSAPVLIVTEDRHFGVAVAQGFTPSVVEASSSTSAPESTTSISALEAVYGKVPQRPSNLSSENSREQIASAVQAEAATQRWSNLFDVPSHALPPVSGLCTSFLELLTTDAPSEQN